MITCVPGETNASPVADAVETGVPAAGVIIPAGGVIVPAGGVIIPAGGVIVLAGGVVKQAGGVIVPAECVLFPAGGVIVECVDSGQRKCPLGFAFGVCMASETGVDNSAASETESNVCKSFF